MKRRQSRYLGIAWESAVIRDCLRYGALELPWKARRRCLPENEPSPASYVGVPLYLPRHRRRAHQLPCSIPRESSKCFANASHATTMGAPTQRPPHRIASWSASSSWSASTGWAETQSA